MSRSSLHRNIKVVAIEMPTTGEAQVHILHIRIWLEKVGSSDSLCSQSPRYDSSVWIGHRGVEVGGPETEVLRIKRINVIGRKQKVSPVVAEERDIEDHPVRQFPRD